MDMKPVDSSNIKAVGYDNSTNELHVEFKHGATYAYEGVPVNLYNEMIAADSVGKYFNMFIKNTFVFRKL